MINKFRKRIKILKDRECMNSTDSIYGENLNKHVNSMVAEGKDPGIFPRTLNLQSGSKDEAKLIYWLISGLI